MLKTLLFGISYFALLNVACRQNLWCESKLIMQALSPDATTKASLYVENCGAMSRDITHVNLHSASQNLQPNMEGRIDDGLILTVRGYHEIEMLWENDESLRLKCLSCAPDTFYKVGDTWRGINIKFQINK
jgi:hypothetical protein